MHIPVLNSRSAGTHVGDLRAQIRYRKVAKPLFNDYLLISNKSCGITQDVPDGPIHPGKDHSILKILKTLNG